MVNLILDESGSMMTCRTETITGLNEFIEDVKTKAEEKVKITLTTFNSGGIKVPYKNVNVKKFAEITREDFRPAGMTPLYDAIGKTIEDIDKRFENKVDKPDIKVVILTDGYENCSSDYDDKDIKKMITSKQKKGWDFVFIGANVDSFAEGGKLGINRASCMDFSTERGARGMHTVVSGAMMKSRAGGMSAMSFSAEDRDRAMGKKDD